MAVQCEWIKIVPIFNNQISKKYICVCAAELDISPINPGLDWQGKREKWLLGWQSAGCTHRTTMPVWPAVSFLRQGFLGVGLRCCCFVHVLWNVFFVKDHSSMVQRTHPRATPGTRKIKPVVRGVMSESTKKQIPWECWSDLRALQKAACQQSTGTCQLRDLLETQRKGYVGIFFSSWRESCWKLQFFTHTHWGKVTVFGSPLRTLQATCTVVRRCAVLSKESSKAAGGPVREGAL